MQNDSFYITGGTLPPDADSYIVRQADTQLLDGLRQGEFCYVLNTRQIGKSSLMVQTALRLRAEGYRVVVLDLTAIGQNLTVEQWYFGLLMRTATQTGHAAALSAFWKSNQAFGPMQRFVEALRTVLLIPREPGETVANLVIFVDEIDAVLSLAFSADEFFAGIRECYNRRPHDDAFNQLTFCLLGVAAPSDLVRDTRISPFNIGLRIELRDFTPDEAEPLARGLRQKQKDDRGNKEPDNRRLLRRVLHWTGGHPYMTQRLCQTIATEQESVEPTKPARLWEQADTRRVDMLCRDLFLTEAARETDDNLTFVRNRLLRSDTDTAALLDFYLRIRRGEAVNDDNTNPLCSLLRLSGIVSNSRGRLKVRNRIYGSVFDTAWVQANLPGEEVRRQRSAYQRGVWRAASVGAAGVLVFLSLAAIALDRSIAANRATKLAQARLSRIYVDSGVRLMDAGDYGGALAPLAEAMLLDKDDPARLAVHRRRFASVLAFAPKLDYLWSSDKPIRWASYSPDKKWIATAGEDGWVHIRQAATGQEMPLKIHHNGQAMYAAFRPDGNWLVTCGDDATAFIWDLESCRLVHTIHLKTREGQSSEVTHASWSKDSKRLALSCGDVVSIWEMKGENSTPRLLTEDTSERAINRQTAFSPDGKYLVTIADNYSGAFIPLAGGKGFDIRTNNMGVSYNAGHVAFSRDGRRLLIAGTFGGAGEFAGAAVLDTKAIRDKPLIPFLAHDQPGNDAAFSPDEKRIATASSDGTARVWDAVTGKPLTPFLRHQGPILHIAFSPDGKRVVTASSDGEARVWDAFTGETICAPLHHAGAVVNAQFGSDSDHVFTASRDGTSRLWTLPRAENLYQRLSKSYPTSVSFSFTEDGSRLVVRNLDLVNTTSTDARIRLYDLTYRGLPIPPLIDATGFSASTANDNDSLLLLMGTGQLNGGSGKDRIYSRLRNVQAWDARTGKPISPLMQADWAGLNHAGTRLLLGDRQGRFQLVDVATGKTLLPSLYNHIGNQVYKHFQSFTPDDKAFLLCDTDHSVRLFDTVTGRPLTPSMEHGSSVSQWQFSPDGRYLFTWTDGSIIQVWNVADGTPASAKILSSEPLNSQKAMQFSPDNRYAITYTTVGYNIWSLDGSRFLKPRYVNTSTHSLVFSPDGRKFVVLDQANWLWNTATLSGIGPSFSDGAEIVSAVFSPDSHRLLAIRDDGTALLWDVRAGRPATPPLLQKKVIRCGFSEDGTMVATGGEDGISRVWDANTGEPITPSFPMLGEVWQSRFSPDGKRLVVAGFKEGRLWNLPDTTESLERLQAQAQLLSGQRIDPTIGSVPIDPVTIRAAWNRLKQ